MVLARWKMTAYRGSSEPRRLAEVVKEMEVSTSLATEEDFRPQKASSKKDSTNGQTWEVDVGKEWIPSEHQVVGKQVASNPLEKNATRKIDLEQYEQCYFGVKWNFSKIRIEPVVLIFLATTESLRNTRSEQSSYNRGKVIKKSSGKLLFAISRHKNHTRVELSYPEIGDKTIAKEEDNNSKWTRVNLRWKGGQLTSPNGPAPKLISQVKTHFLAGIHELQIS